MTVRAMVGTAKLMLQRGELARARELLELVRQVVPAHPTVSTPGGLLDQARPVAAAPTTAETP